MIDNDKISDGEIVRLVQAKDNELAKLVQARLRRLRLARVITSPPHRPGPTLLAVVRKRLGWR